MSRCVGSHTSDAWTQNKCLVRCSQISRQLDVISTDELVSCFVCFFEIFGNLEFGKPRRSPIYEAAAYPCLPNAEKHKAFEEKATCAKLQRGQWETLHRIGAVLKAMPCVKYILADRHGSHGWAGSLLLGRPVNLSAELSAEVPFFFDLAYEILPRCVFPIPYRISMLDGSSVHFFPGPAHAQKAFAEQMRTCLAKPCFGLLPADFAGCLDLGLFATSYIGTDTMSDKQAALLLLGFLLLPGKTIEDMYWLNMVDSIFIILSCFI